MTAMALLLLALIAATVAGVHYATGNHVLRSRVKRRALVTTTSGAWFAGVLLDHDRSSFLLVQATTEGPDGSVAPVDGEVLILASDVAHIQFP